MWIDGENGNFKFLGLVLEVCVARAFHVVFGI